MKNLLQRIAGLTIWMMGLDVLAAGPGKGGGSGEGVAVVNADGSITAPREFAAKNARHQKPQMVRYDFGLPRQAPAQQWLEDDTLPICHTRWEKDGIRYTQTVLVTRLETAELLPSGITAVDAVLMVRIVGENFTNVYAEAKADLSAEIAGRNRNLELQDGLARLTDPDASGLLAVIDVSAAGIVSTNGSQIRFFGNMPPGNSGSMTIKFPLATTQGSKEIESLRDLEFDKEFQRVKRFWANQPKAGTLPVAFSPRKP